MTTPEQPLETVGERYVLVEQLADHDDREVWRGHDDLAGRRVIVTRYLSPTEDWRIVFDRRARQLEALADPGIASLLAHDATADLPWLASAYVDGESAATICEDPGLSTDDALAVIGQAALALTSPHSAGIGHGALTADHVLVRPDGSIALIGFAMDRTPAPADDIAALDQLARQLLGDGAPHEADVTSFLRLLDGGDWSNPSDIGRTALALAAAQRLHGAPDLISRSVTDAVNATTEPPRPWYDDDERKRIRNRLIALGAIVVLGGAALLRFFTAGSGETTVPNVIGEPFSTAQHDLNEQGLRDKESPEGSVGVVLAQSPSGGQRAKVGSVVSLTVAGQG